MICDQVEEAPLTELFHPLAEQLTMWEQLGYVVDPDCREKLKSSLQLAPLGCVSVLLPRLTPTKINLRTEAVMGWPAWSKLAEAWHRQGWRLRVDESLKDDLTRSWRLNEVFASRRLLVERSVPGDLVHWHVHVHVSQSSAEAQRLTVDLNTTWNPLSIVDIGWLWLVNQPFASKTGWTLNSLSDIYQMTGPVGRRNRFGSLSCELTTRPTPTLTLQTAGQPISPYSLIATAP